MNSIELFSGAGGLALGLEKAGFNHIALSEFNKDACTTLKKNRPEWNVLSGDVRGLNWGNIHNNVHLVSGGFPCQAFSYSGKRLGLEDTRGTLFYEFARCLNELKPICFLAENVKGLLTHDSGKTLATIIDTFKSLGYFVYAPLLLNANHYEVAQKRERIFICGVQEHYKNNFSFTTPPTFPPITLKDVLLEGSYYPSMPESLGLNYSAKKQFYFQFIPEGGNWRDLTVEQQKTYMGKMFDSSGGRTGVLKRLSWSEASVTILTSPSQTQTERCHPSFIRPLNIRESARIQSFPDDWIFSGSLHSQYKQIGNAVPVNLAFHVGKMIYKQLEKIVTNS